MTRDVRSIRLACALLAALLTTAVYAGGERGEADAPPADYIIVHPPHLRDAAQAWAAYRSEAGRQVLVHEVAGPVVEAGDAADAVDADAVGHTVRNTLRALVRERFAAYRAGRGAEQPPFAVLLLGDVPDADAPASGIPTFSFAQHDPHLGAPRHDSFVSDHPYQCVRDDDSVPAFALGRVPARTAEEALATLAKVRAYEREAEPGPWRQRVVYTAGEGRFGPFDGLLEGLAQQMIEHLVPLPFDVHVTYCKPTSPYCPPPQQVTDVFLKRLSEPSLLFNYIGHGSATGFDRLIWRDGAQPMLGVEDLARLDATAAAPRPIALLLCCSAGWYDLPGGRPSLAEAMLLHPGGPVAVIAGSRMTHPYANTILQKDVTDLLFNRGIETIGELDRLAMHSMIDIDRVDRQLDAVAAPIARLGGWRSTLAQHRAMHVRLYNLLGDPAMRIARPLPVIDDLRIEDGVLRGLADDLATGRATIRIETTRAAFADADAVQPVDGPNDPELPAKAQANYALVNERTLRTATTVLDRGELAWPLPQDLSPAAAVLRVYVEGERADGTAAYAAGALRLPGAAPAAGAAAPPGASQSPAVPMLDFTHSADR